MPKVKRRNAKGAPIVNITGKSSKIAQGVIPKNAQVFKTPTQALEVAHHALDTLCPEDALNTLRIAVKQFNSSPELYEMLGTVELECVNLYSSQHQSLISSVPEDMDKVDPEILKAADELNDKIVKSMENATNALSRAVQLLPNRGYSKYLYLGQMNSENTALEYYKKGIEILENDLKVANQVNDVELSNDLKCKLAGALCAVTDIYLTDCCDYAEAESSCVQFTQRAIEVDPMSPEAYQTYASVSISRNLKNEALNAAEKSFSLWYPSYLKQKDILINDEMNIDDDKENTIAVPDYPARVALAKILIELTSYESALKVVSTLLDENDEECEGLYLAGFVSYLIAGGTIPDEESNPTINITNEDYIEHLSNANEYFRQLIHVYKIIGGIDEMAIQQAEALLNVIEPILNAYKPDEMSER